jgi:hypothetical protein
MAMVLYGVDLVVVESVDGWRERALLVVERKDK